MKKVCEVSTWNYVKKAPGFIGETSIFSEVDSRELRLLHEDHTNLDIPMNYEKFKLVNVNHSNPKAIEPRKVKVDKPQVNFEKTPSRKTSQSELNVQKEIESYTAGGIGIYPCTTPSCKWPSASMFESAKCEKCSKE
jgi:hypothetical protein